MSASTRGDAWETLELSPEMPNMPELRVVLGWTVCYSQVRGEHP